MFFTSLFAIFTGLHSVPLLRPTPGFSPPRSLTKPLAHPLLSTTLILVLPILLLVSLIVTLAVSSGRIDWLGSISQTQAEMFLNVSLPTNSTAEVSVTAAWANGVVPRGSNQTTLGSGDFGLMMNTLGEAWEGILWATKLESALKAVATSILVLILAFVEVKVWWRLCGLIAVSDFTLHFVHFITEIGRRTLRWKNEFRLSKHPPPLQCLALRLTHPYSPTPH